MKAKYDLGFSTYSVPARPLPLETLSPPTQHPHLQSYESLRKSQPFLCCGRFLQRSLIAPVISVSPTPSPSLSLCQSSCLHLPLSGSSFMTFNRKWSTRLKSSSGVLENRNVVNRGRGRITNLELCGETLLDVGVIG